MLRDCGFNLPLALTFNKIPGYEKPSFVKEMGYITVLKLLKPLIPDNSFNSRRFHAIPDMFEILNTGWFY
jgi:hypothetical protein